MAITVKYFGAIVEQTKVEEEQFSLEEVGNTIEDLKNHCMQKYAGIANLTFQLAVNQQLGSVELNDGDEVAFLPPFAGG